MFDYLLSPLSTQLKVCKPLALQIISPLPAQHGSVMASPCLLQCSPAALPPTSSRHSCLETESSLHFISEKHAGLLQTGSPALSSPHAANQSQTFQSVALRMIHGMDSGSQARKLLLPVPEGSGPKSQMQESQCIKNSQRSQLEPSHILPAGRDVHSLLPKGIRGNSLQMGAQPRNYPLPSAATIAKQIRKKRKIQVRSLERIHRKYTKCQENLGN